MLLASSVLVMSLVSHSELDQFRELIYHDAKKSLIFYDNFKERLKDDTSDGSLEFRRLALIGASRANDFEAQTTISQHMMALNYSDVSKESKAKVIMTFGGIYLMNRQIDEAIKHFKCAKQLDSRPELGRLIGINKAIAYMKNKQYELAFQTMQAIDDSQLDVRAKAVKRMIEGNFLFYEHRYEEAIKAYQHAYALYRKEDDHLDQMRVLQNLLFASVGAQNWHVFDRYYAYIVENQPQQGSEENRAWVAILLKTKRFKLGELSKDEYLQNIEHRIARLTHESADEVNELSLMIQIPLSPPVVPVSIHSLPNELGAAWCTDSFQSVQIN
ncbi:hypothetical protein PALB_37630 [Pseudoalteromonas luteoviolacea B = ATCC 29581]|nr:hypothetical protein PALB_37630 [Pseudoalteromonas luteoviolacea B = ATCC 29581]